MYYGNGTNKENSIGKEVLEAWDKMKEGVDLLRNGEAVLIKKNGKRRIVEKRSRENEN